MRLGWLPRSYHSSFLLASREEWARQDEEKALPPGMERDLNNRDEPGIADCPKNTSMISSCLLLAVLFCWKRQRGGAVAKQENRTEEMSPAEERNLRELQASWAVKEALGILELRDENDLRPRLWAGSSLLFPTKGWRGANKDKSPCDMPECAVKDSSPLKWEIKNPRLKEHTTLKNSLGAVLRGAQLWFLPDLVLPIKLPEHLPAPHHLSCHRSHQARGFERITEIWKP